VNVPGHTNALFVLDLTFDEARLRGDGAREKTRD
jgi:hypothetical protein